MKAAPIGRLREFSFLYLILKWLEAGFPVYAVTLISFKNQGYGIWSCAGIGIK